MLPLSQPLVSCRPTLTRLDQEELNQLIIKVMKEVGHKLQRFSGGETQLPWLHLWCGLWEMTVSSQESPEINEDRFNRSKCPSVSNWGLCKRTNDCTLTPSTHSLTLKLTNGKIPSPTRHHSWPNPADDMFKQMQKQCRRGNEKDNRERMNAPLWPAADVPSDYCNTDIKASAVPEPLSLSALETWARKGL